MMIFFALDDAFSLRFSPITFVMPLTPRATQVYALLPLPPMIIDD